MLKHEDNPQAPSSSAAKVRVTPEELAAAVTALQIRKEGQPGTIAIGEAVEELGLDVSPEEVLAEVQARRQVVEPKRRRDYRALACAIACVVPLAFGGIYQATQHPMPSTSFDATAVPEAHSLLLDPNHLQVEEIPSKRLVLMSEVQDNQPVRCNLSNQDVQLAFYQWTPGLTTQTSWVLIKHHGKAYVRGWTDLSSAERAETEGLEVRSTPNRVYDIRITLPIEGFEAVPYDDHGSVVRFRATDVSLDRHANEKW